MRARRRAAARRRAFRPLLIVPLLAVALSATVVFSAANVVASSKAAYRTSPVTANQLKPTLCNSLNLTTVVVGAGGTINGTNGNDLILGGGGGLQWLNGLNGTDCIVGGSGFSIIDGGAGVDVCIGGPGFDFFSTCETFYQ